MREERNCKIVQDLLPNYIEKLTNEETNNFIEEHLNECTDCKKILENMKKDVDLNAPKRNEKEVKYIKKYNKKLKLLSTFLILILLTFAILVGRKVIIITNISRKIEENRNPNNYHIKEVRYSNGTMTDYEIYYKDNKVLYKATQYSREGKIRNFIAYQSESESFSLDDFEGNKRLTKVSNIIVPNSSYTEDFTENLKFIFTKNVKTQNLNGIECYVISDGENKEYIDKKTGSIVKEINIKMDYILNIEYEYGTVKDEDIKRPDTTGYTLQERW